MGFYGKTHLINVNGWNFNKYTTFPNMKTLMEAAKQGFKSEENIGDNPTTALVDGANIYVIDYELIGDSEDNISTTPYKKNYDIDLVYFSAESFSSSSAVSQGTNGTYVTDSLLGTTYRYRSDKGDHQITLSQTFERLNSDYNEYGYKTGFNGTAWEVRQTGEGDITTGTGKQFFFLLIGNLYQEWPQITLEIYSPAYAAKVLESGESFPRVNTKTSTPSDIRISAAPSWNFENDIILENSDNLGNPNTIYQKPDPEDNNKEDAFTITFDNKTLADSNLYLEQDKNKNEFSNLSVTTRDTKQFKFDLGKLNSAIGTLYNQFYGTDYTEVGATTTINRNAVVQRFTSENTGGNKGLLLQIGDRDKRECSDFDWGDPTSMWGNVGLRYLLDDNGDPGDELSTNSDTMWGNVGLMWGNVGTQGTISPDTMWGNIGKKNPTEEEKEANKNTMWGIINDIQDDIANLQALAEVKDQLINLITSTKNEKTVVVLTINSTTYTISSDSEWTSAIDTVNKTLSLGNSNARTGIFKGLSDFSSIELSIPGNLSNKELNFIINNNYNITNNSNGNYFLSYAELVPTSFENGIELHIEITH